jgi:hypothetical protein
MTARPTPGTPLVFRWRKWDGSPHWEHDCVFLGSGWVALRVAAYSPLGGMRVTLSPFETVSRPGRALRQPS